MSRSYKSLPYNWGRNPRGYRQAMVNDVRKGAIPPSPWDDPAIDRQTRLVFRMIGSLKVAGCDRDEIIRRVRARYGFTQLQAEEMVPPFESVNLWSPWDYLTKGLC